MTSQGLFANPDAIDFSGPQHVKFAIVNASKFEDGFARALDFSSHEEVRLLGPRGALHLVCR